MNVNFETAEIVDAPILTKISIDAFHSDFIVAGRESIGGPPGYDSIKFHEQMIEDSSGFYKILSGDTIIGCFWFTKENEENAYLYRIFIDPNFHCKNIGSQAFEFLFRKFPKIGFWSLKVPIWNSRTPNFYHKIGFKIKERSDRFIFFIKEIRTNENNQLINRTY